MIDSGLLSPTWVGTQAHRLTTDEAWLAAMVRAEVALAAAQARLGVIPESTAAAIASAAADIDVTELAVAARGAGNPVVGLVPRLTAQVPKEAADGVHRGATSQDILDSATMLIARQVVDGIRADLRRVVRSLSALAVEHRTTAMPGRTLTQHAVPTTFGLKAAGWTHQVLAALRALDRLELPAQLGGAAGTLAAFQEYGAGVPLIREFARELGLAEPVVPWHVLRAPVAELGAALTLTGGALGKVAIDVQTLTRTEIAELAEPAAPGRGGSSAMPQKRNPVLATLLVTAARQLPGYCAILHGALLQEDERSAGGWHAEWQPLREMLRLTGGAAATAAELTEGLRVFPEQMRRNLDITDGGIISERLSVVLAGRLGKAEAKRLLTELSAWEAPLAEAPELAELGELLDPAEYIGAAPELVDRAVAEAAAYLG
ncbi:3-carboxy-cis,cis-muconate cycloisomerase [Pseudonocardiaceae bacterium YIM PH 21723]|nr:3-carboxy-cis,cis-muconate cycloisomerase [Pseudonocardiaceae bacterium YIM PH 21723]